MSFKNYVVIVEQGDTSYGAYVPDLPGCVAISEAKDEVLVLIKEAITLHIEMLRAQGLAIPEPCSLAELVEVQAA